MTLLALLILLTIAGICGAIGELIVGRRIGGGNVVITIIIGVIGAYLGTWIASMLSTIIPLPRYTLTVGNMPLDVIWSILGSVLVLLLLAALRSNRALRTNDAAARR